MRVICADFEADGLLDEVTKIHCMGVHELIDNKSTRNFELIDYVDMEVLIREPDVFWILHNGKGYDEPLVKKILGIEFAGEVIDSYGLSMYLEPTRKTHNLADYGEEFGIPKPVVDDWEGLTQAEYVHRVAEDVKIQTKLWKKQYSKLKSMYTDDEAIIHCCRYITSKMYALYIAAKTKIKVNRVDCEALHKDFDERFEFAKENMARNMPDVPVYATRKPPAKPYKKDGSLSATGLRWKELMEAKGLPFGYRFDTTVQVGTSPPNAGSHKQVKDYLHGLGWNPETFDFKRNKETGEVRKIPQVRSSETGELCPSVARLEEKDPSIRYLGEMGILSHRKSVVNGFLKAMDSDDCIEAGSSGFTNTLRLRHRTIVNLPSSRKPYGKEIRSLLITKSRRSEFLGSDLCSLEDKIKQHYIFPFDPEYVKELQAEGYDPHLAICLQAGMLTQAEVDEYKSEDTSEAHKAELGLIRHKGKGTNYSAQYGAGGATIARAAGVPEAEGSVLHDAYWTKNWAIKAVADRCIVRKIRGHNWLYNPVSKLWYHLKTEKDRFSTLVQGTASYVFDMWLNYVLEHRPQVNLQIHDEFLLEVRKGYREPASKIVQDGIDYVNDQLKLNVELSCDIEFGDTYYDCH